MTLTQAKEKLPKLTDDELDTAEQSFDMMEQTEALELLNGWTITGWAETINLEIVRSERYTCMFQQNERRIWFQIPQGIFQEIATKLP